MASRYLHEEAFVDTYLSDHMANVKYPYRMQPVKHASPTTCDESEKHILDSSIGKDFGNDTVIEKANYLGCDVVVPADVIDDHEATVDQVLDMLEQCVEHDFRTLIPIQGETPDDYITNARDMVDTIEDNGYEQYVDRYAVGGVKDASTSEQMTCLESVYDAIGDPVHVFGAGLSTDWIRYIRQNHEMIQSLDMATPMYVAKSGKFARFDAVQIDNKKPRGTHVSFTNARLAEAMMTQFNYMICDGPDDENVEEILSRTE